MIHVLLDTSIYRSDPPRRRAAFQTLTALCEAREITLHVPSIVKREFVSHLANKTEALLAETLVRVKKLRKAGAANDTRQMVSTAVTALEGLNGKYAEFVQESFDAWLNQTHATVHEVQPECVNDVLDRYFSGDLPFKQVKNRDDFPDAFIWQIVSDVAGQHDALIAVVADTNLREAISSIPKVEVFESLEAFIESERVQQLFAAAFAQIHADEILRAFESDNTFMNQGLLDGINATVVDEVTLNFRDDEESRIVDVSKIINSRFDFGQAQYYGENTFRIPFEAEGEATLDYFLLKTSYYEMPDEESDSLGIEDPDWNPSYMWVSELRTLAISGTLSISIDVVQVIPDPGEHLDPQAVKDFSEVAVDEIDSLEIKHEGPM
jgi:hypothetical protein